MYYIGLINLHAYLTQSNGEYIYPVSNILDDIAHFEDQVRQENFKVYLMLMDVMEGRVYSKEEAKIIDDIRTLVSSMGYGYVFVLDSDQLHLSEIPESPDIIFINQLSVVTYARTILNPLQETNPKWNSSASKGLFIPGKMDRPHRIHLITKLWEDQSLGHLEWSMNMSADEEARCLSLLDNNVEKFELLKKGCVRSLDLQKAEEYDSGDFAFNGFPYDVNLYSDNLFSIITESDFSGQIGRRNHWLPKLTEKTYRAIVNRHPFICCWYPGMVKHIESMGFKSFKEYMPIPDYNEPESLQERISKTAYNIAHFDPSKYEDQIREDVEHNYNHFVSIAEAEIAKMQRVFDLSQKRNPDFGMTLNRFVGFNFPTTFLSRNWEPKI